MPSRKKLSSPEKDLIRRYLIWCYKTTKEELDRVDRYFTQAIVDEKLLKALKSEAKKAGDNPVLTKKVEEFQTYMDTKMKNVLPKKYLDVSKKVLQPEYWYLQTRFKAIEQAIVSFLGEKELRSVQNLYETEMTRRILEAREHT